MTNYFKDVTKNGALSNQECGNFVKYFLSKKGGIVRSDISLVKNDIGITNDQELTEIFNDHYVHIVEESSGKKPVDPANDTGIPNDREIVRLILFKIQNKY